MSELEPKSKRKKISEQERKVLNNIAAAFIAGIFATFIFFGVRQQLEEEDKVTI